MRNGILAGIAVIAVALGLGAVLTASYDNHRASYGLHIDEGRASTQRLEPQTVSDEVAR